MDIGRKLNKINIFGQNLPKVAKQQEAKEAAAAQEMKSILKPQNDDTPVLPPKNPDKPPTNPEEPTQKPNKLADWLDKEYFAYPTISEDICVVDSNSNIDLSKLDDPSFIDNYLEPYKNTLSEKSYSSEKHTLILNTLEQELRNYYKEHGENGLSSFLDNKFNELMQEIKYDYDEFMQALDKEYANKEVTKDEAKQYVEDFCNALKDNLIKTKGYDSAYAEKIAEFLKQKADFSEETINLSELLNAIKLLSEELTGETKLEYFEGNFYDGDIIKNIHKKANLSIQNEFFEYLIMSSCDLSNKKDFDVFMQKVLRDAFSKIDGLNKFEFNWTRFREEAIVNMSDLIKLDSNGDSSWFDEFYSIINTYASQINKTSNYKEATVIDIESLFGDKDTLTPAELSDMLDDMMFSDDIGLVKLRSVINDAFSKLGIDNYPDERELFKYLFRMINDKLGIENTNPPTISRDAIKQLNDNNIFDILSKMLQSEELKDAYYFDIDDEIDDYSISYAGNCWFIGDIASLNSSPKGRQILKDSMTFNDDGSITITFKGAGKSYTITKEEIEAAKKKNEKYSFGDNTVLLFAIATAKLRTELGETYDDNNPLYKGFEGQLINWLAGEHPYNINSKGMASDILNNITDEQLKALIECKGESWAHWLIKNKLEELGYNGISREELFDLFKPGIASGDVIMTISMSAKIFEFTTTDGEKYVYDAQAGIHAFGVKYIDTENNTVTIWDNYSKKEYTIPFSQLLEQGCGIGYRIISDDYELPEKMQCPDIDLYDLLGFDPDNIQYDKTTFNDEIVLDTSMTIEEILDSDDSPLCKIFNKYFVNILRNNGFEDKDRLMDAMLTNICKCIYTICNNMPNYTDYIALKEAYTKTMQYFVDKISEILSRLIEICDEYFDGDLVQMEYLLTAQPELLERFLGTTCDITIKDIFETFLSFLPDDSE